MEINEKLRNIWEKGIKELKENIIYIFGFLSIAIIIEAIVLGSR